MSGEHGVGSQGVCGHCGDGNSAGTVEYKPKLGKVYFVRGTGK